MTVCTTTQIDTGECFPYIYFNFEYSGTVNFITRTYVDFLTAFGNIGGFKELVFMSMLVLYSLYNEIMRKKYLNSKMVDIENTKIFFENNLLDKQIKTVGDKDQVQIKLGNRESIIHSTEKGFDDAKGTELEQLRISEKDKKDQRASSMMTKLISPSVVKPGSNQTAA